MAFSVSSSPQSSEINVTPLIDVLLVLLIIFMVIAPSPKQGLDSSIPQGKAVPTQVLGPVVVRMLADASGGPVRYQVDGENVAYEAVAGRMRTVLAVGKGREVSVEADRRLSYAAVAEVVGLARQEGAGAVVLDRLEE